MDAPFRNLNFVDKVCESLRFPLDLVPAQRGNFLGKKIDKFQKNMGKTYLALHSSEYSRRNLERLFFRVESLNDDAQKEQLVQKCIDIYTSVNKMLPAGSLKLPSKWDCNPVSNSVEYEQQLILQLEELVNNPVFGSEDSEKILAIIKQLRQQVLTYFQLYDVTKNERIVKAFGTLFEKLNFVANSYLINHESGPLITQILHKFPHLPISNQLLQSVLCENKGTEIVWIKFLEGINFGTLSALSLNAIHLILLRDLMLIAKMCENNKNLEIIKAFIKNSYEFLKEKPIAVGPFIDAKQHLRTLKTFSSLCANLNVFEVNILPEEIKNIVNRTFFLCLGEEADLLTVDGEKMLSLVMDSEFFRSMVFSGMRESNVLEARSNSSINIELFERDELLLLMSQLYSKNPLTKTMNARETIAFAVLSNKIQSRAGCFVSTSLLKATFSRVLVGHNANWTVDSCATAKRMITICDQQGLVHTKNLFLEVIEEQLDKVFTKERKFIVNDLGVEFNIYNLPGYPGHPEFYSTFLGILDVVSDCVNAKLSLRYLNIINYFVEMLLYHREREWWTRPGIVNDTVSWLAQVASATKIEATQSVDEEFVIMSGETKPLDIGLTLDLSFMSYNVASRCLSALNKFPFKKLSMPNYRDGIMGKEFFTNFEKQSIRDSYPGTEIVFYGEK